MFSWNLTSFIYIWNLTSPILQARDVELNPGPHPIDPNPVISVICSKKINRGPNLEAAASCSNENCDALCHLRCNGLTTALSCHARGLNNEICWFCPQRGNGKAQAIQLKLQLLPLLHLKESKFQLWERRARYVRKPFKLDMQPLLTTALIHLAALVPITVILTKTDIVLYAERNNLTDRNLLRKIQIA